METKIGPGDFVTSGSCPGGDPQEGFRHYRATGDRRVRNELVEEHRWIARVAAQRFTNRGEPAEDLHQVALLGLLKALERFDPDHGASFASFALPTIIGELRRHFRDTTWSLRVPRRAKDLHLAVNAAVEPLTHQLGRAPHLGELAQAVGVSVDEVVEAMEAGNAYRTAPLTPRPGENGGGDDSRLAGGEDISLLGAEERVVLRQVVAELPERERRILYLRFFGDLTQSEIAKQIGVSQVHASRLLRAALEKVRGRIEQSKLLSPPQPGPEIAAVPAPPRVAKPQPALV